MAILLAVSPAVISTDAFAESAAALDAWTPELGITMNHYVRCIREAGGSVETLAGPFITHWDACEEMLMMKFDPKPYQVYAEGVPDEADDGRLPPRTGYAP